MFIVGTTRKTLLMFNYLKRAFLFDFFDKICIKIQIKLKYQPTIMNMLESFQVQEVKVLKIKHLLHFFIFFPKPHFEVLL
jgi:hypothetical protein